MDNLNNTGANNSPQNTGGTGSPTPQMPPITPSSHEETGNKSSVGPIIGSVVVVLVIVLGGIYLYGERLKDKINEEAPVENIKAEDQATNSLEQQGSSDSLSEISADLQASDFNGLDAESMAIEQELSAE